MAHTEPMKFPSRAVAAGEGTGRKNFTENHACDDKPHSALRILGEEDQQKAQYGAGPHDLFQQLGEGGRTDHAGAVEGVLMEVFYPSKEDAGQQQ